MAYAQFRLGSRNRFISLEVVRFVTNSGSAPTSYVDDGKILASTPFTIGGTGRITVNLADRWKRIYIVGIHMPDATAGDGAGAYADVTEGMSGANSVELKTVDGGALSNTSGKTVHLTLALSH